MRCNQPTRRQFAIHLLLALTYVASLVSQLAAIASDDDQKFSTVLTPPNVAYSACGAVYLLTTVLIVWQLCEDIYGSLLTDMLVNALLMVAFAILGVVPHLLSLDSTRAHFVMCLLRTVILAGVSLFVRFQHSRLVVQLAVDTNTAWAIFIVTLSSLSYLRHAVWATMGAADDLAVDAEHEASYVFGLLSMVLIQAVFSVVCADFTFGLVSLWSCSWISVGFLQKVPLHSMPSLKYCAGSSILVSIGIIIIGAFLTHSRQKAERVRQQKATLDRQQAEANRILNEMLDAPSGTVTVKAAGPEPTPVIIDTPSVPHSDASLLA